MSSAQERLWVREQLRNDVERWVSVLSGERPDDAPARTNFDLYLFAQVGFLLADVEQELIGIAEWEQAIRDIERCMNNNPSVRVFEDDLRRAGQAPLASRTFLDLAKRRVRRKANKGTSDSQRPPTFSEGLTCAEVLLAYDTAKDRWNRGLNPDELSKRIAEDWLSHRSLDDLLFIIRGSEESRIYWNALELICDALGGKDVLGSKWESAKDLDDLPYALLIWYFEAGQELRRPPRENAAPPNRPIYVGYVIRNQHIRHTIRVLAQLGMPPTAGRDTDGQDFGCCVVAEVLGLSERYIGDIWGTPDMTMSEFHATYVDPLLA